MCVCVFQCLHAVCLALRRKGRAVGAFDPGRTLQGVAFRIEPLSSRTSQLQKF